MKKAPFLNLKFKVQRFKDLSIKYWVLSIEQKKSLNF